MEHEILKQIVLAVAGIAGSVFVTIRYVANVNKKREEKLFEHTERTQKMMLEYFETKNGQLERVSKEFTKTNKKMSSAINNLATKIEVLGIVKTSK